MNWVETIELIQKAGFSQSDIARRCKCSQPSINELATGKTKDPRDSIGHALRQLVSEIESAKQTRRAKRQAVRSA